MEKDNKVAGKNLPLFSIVLFLAVGVLVFSIAMEEYGSFIKHFLADTSTASVTVSNALPVASGSALNSGNAITLTENTTTSITAAGTVTDNNGCLDLASVKIAVYKLGTTCTEAGHADNDLCYFYEDTTPDDDPSCSGAGDTTYVASNAFSIQYYADPEAWLTTITPVDGVGAGTADSSTLVTLNDLAALNVGGTISYGSVAPGDSSTGDHTETVTDTGNIAIDFKVSGEALTCTSGTIAVGSQEYGLASFSYGDGTDLSTSPTDVNGVFGTPESDTVPISDITYWQVEVPTGVSGTCEGSVTFTAQAAL